MKTQATPGVPNVKTNKNQRQTVHDLKKFLTKKLTVTTVLQKMAYTGSTGHLSLIRDTFLWNYRGISTPVL